MQEPTPEQCKARAVVREGDEIHLAIWHPQWGGYAGKAWVSFDRVSGAGEGGTGCFLVRNYHDGQFPTSMPTAYHYCGAAQLIAFGIELEETLRAHQVDLGGQPVRPSDWEREHLRGLADRLRKLADG